MTTIGSSTTQGAYIMNDEGGWVSANSPSNCDLSNLVDGLGYVHIAEVTTIVYTINNQSQGMFQGFEMSPAGPGGAYATTIGNQMGGIVVRGIVSEASAFKCKRFAKNINRIGNYPKYFGRQYAANSWMQFPNAGLSSRKYSRIIVTLYAENEKDTAGKDSKVIEFHMEEVWNE